MTAIGSFGCDRSGVDRVRFRSRVALSNFEPIFQRIVWYILSSWVTGYSLFEMVILQYLWFSGVYRILFNYYYVLLLLVKLKSITAQDPFPICHTEPFAFGVNRVVVSKDWKNPLLNFQVCKFHGKMTGLALTCIAKSWCSPKCHPLGSGYSFFPLDFFGQVTHLNGHGKNASCIQETWGDESQRFGLLPFMQGWHEHLDIYPRRPPKKNL